MCIYVAVCLCCYIGKINLFLCNILVVVIVNSTLIMKVDEIHEVVGVGVLAVWCVCVV